LKTQVIAAIVLSIFTNIGCSVSTLMTLGLLSPKGEKQNEHTYKYKDESSARRIFDSHVVECGTQSKNCNPSIGSLVAVNEEFAHVCTAVLIKEDVVATNSHCVPEVFANDRGTGQSSLKIVFPGGESRECEEVLAKSKFVDDTLLIQADYSFIRVKPDASRGAKRPFLKISREGIRDKTAYQVVAVTGEPGITRKIGSTTCRAIQRSRVNPYTVSDLSPLFTLADCPLVEGNSGAPVLSGDQTSALGLISARLTYNYTRYVGGTNFTCVSTPFLSDSNTVGDECNQSYSRQEKDIRDRELESIHGKLWAERLLELAQKQVQWLSKIEGDILQWEFKLQSEGLSEMTWVPVPKCFKPVEKWASRYIKKGFISDSYLDQQENYFNDVSWTVKTVENSDGQMLTLLDEKPKSFSRYEFNPNEAIGTGYGTVYLVRARSFGFVSKTPYRLNVCSK
jgi:hypothetical protein